MKEDVYKGGLIMEYRYYIAYGSNINKRQMAQRCPDSTLIGRSFVEDFKLSFKGEKDGIYLTIEKSKGSRVPVLVWKTSLDDEKTLDIYEDFPNLYYKDIMEVNVKLENSHENKLLKAYVYKMHDDFKHGLPSRIYYNTCLEGYEEVDFDKTILENALNESEDLLNN